MPKNKKHSVVNKTDASSEEECEECHTDLSKHDHKMSCGNRLSDSLDTLLPSRELNDLLEKSHKEFKGFSKQIKKQIIDNKNLRIKSDAYNSIPFDWSVPPKPIDMLEAEIKELKDKIFCLTDDRDHWAVFHYEMVALVLHGDHRAKVNLEPGGGDGSRAMDQIKSMHEKIRQLEVSPTFHQGWDAAIDLAAQVCDKVVKHRKYDGGPAAMECATEIKKYRSSKKEMSNE